MDLDLLDATLTDLGQPAFRAKQVWEWTARGAKGYAEMTNLPEALRAQLAERVPLSSLTVKREALASDGTEKALFHT
ncbi:MAG: 23S rRNA (adenine(2503)-C(2))-methyltransferase RlmN, partial [Thermoleophilaceae bacterium]